MNEPQARFERKSPPRVLMSTSVATLLVVTATAVQAQTTSASDIAADGQNFSPATAREAMQIIREAGYECREVQTIEVPSDPPPGSGSFGIQMVLCSNGKKFLIARSGRDRGSARPVVRQLN